MAALQLNTSQRKVDVTTSSGWVGLFDEAEVEDEEEKEEDEEEGVVVGTSLLM